MNAVTNPHDVSRHCTAACDIDLLQKVVTPLFESSKGNIRMFLDALETGRQHALRDHGVKSLAEERILDDVRRLAWSIYNALNGGVQ